MIDAIAYKNEYLLHASYGQQKFADIVMDSERCLQLAKLTDHQLNVIYLRWKLGHTLKQCATYLGCSIEAVRQSEAAAKTKMQKVLNTWGI